MHGHPYVGTRRDAGQTLRQAPPTSPIIPRASRFSARGRAARPPTHSVHHAAMLVGRPLVVGRRYLGQPIFIGNNLGVTNTRMTVLVRHPGEPGTRVTADSTNQTMYSIEISVVRQRGRNTWRNRSAATLGVAWPTSDEASLRRASGESAPFYDTGAKRPMHGDDEVTHPDNEQVSAQNPSPHNTGARHRPW